MQTKTKETLSLRIIGIHETDSFTDGGILWQRGERQIQPKDQSKLDLQLYSEIFQGIVIAIAERLDGIEL